SRASSSCRAEAATSAEEMSAGASEYGPTSIVRTCAPWSRTFWASHSYSVRFVSMVPIRTTFTMLLLLADCFVVSSVCSADQHALWSTCGQVDQREVTDVERVSAA